MEVVLCFVVLDVWMVWIDLIVCLILEVSLLIFFCWVVEVVWIWLLSSMMMVIEMLIMIMMSRSRMGLISSIVMRVLRKSMVLLMVFVSFCVSMVYSSVVLVLIWEMRFFVWCVLNFEVGRCRICVMSL